MLEGLNACLDHRETVYIPELDRSFHCPSTFRVFAAQNPVGQGGGRKGLPKSFLNRFSKVYVDALTRDDLLVIAQTVFPSIAEVPLSSTPSFKQWQTGSEPEGLRERSLLSAMIDFNSLIARDCGCEGVWDVPIQPWQEEEKVEEGRREEKREGRRRYEKEKVGRLGSPWEFNLRDVFRWAELSLSLAK